jgi:hypothetical protein
MPRARIDEESGRMERELDGWISYEAIKDL